LQLECARSTGVNRIVFQIGEPHAALEEALKQATPQGSEELVRPATPDVILQFLEDRVRSLRKAGVGTSGSLPTVYVVCSLTEYEDALRLKHCIEAEGRFAATLTMLQAEDALDRLEDHRMWLETSEAVVVFWGPTSPERWFREQQRDVIVARQKRQARPLPGLCLSLHPHANPEALNRPDLPFEQVSDLECSNLSRFFRYLDIGTSGDRR
jgi:hypothetical protein